MNDERDSKVEKTEKAAEFAGKLKRLVDIAVRKEKIDQVNVRTIEVCRAMGRPEGASMEEVSDFICETLPCFQGSRINAYCGCGYLSLMLIPEEREKSAFEENRAIIDWTPEDIDKYIIDERTD